MEGKSVGENNRYKRNKQILVPENKCFKCSVLHFARQNLSKARWGVNHAHEDVFGPVITWKEKILNKNPRKAGATLNRCCKSPAVLLM